MILKLTGVDTAGKSTLASQLEEHGFVTTYHPFSPGRSSLFEHYAARIAATGDVDTVWDRGFITEHVYGSVLREQSRLSNPEFDALVRELAAVPGVIVYVWEPQDVLSDRLRESQNNHPEHAQVRQHLPELFERYDQVLEQAARGIRVVSFRPSTDDASSLVAIRDQHHNP